MTISVSGPNSISALKYAVGGVIAAGVFAALIASSPLTAGVLLVAMVAGCSSGEDKELLRNDAGISLTPDGGVPINADAFSSPDGGISIPNPQDGPMSTDGATGPIILSGGIYSQATQTLDIPLIQAPGTLLSAQAVTVTFATNSTLITPTSCQPTPPCEDGLLRMTATPPGDGGTCSYVSNPLDPNTRPPLYVISYTLTDTSGKGLPPVSVAIPRGDIRLLGVACPPDQGLRPGAVSYVVDVPNTFWSDGQLKATLSITLLTRNDLFVPGSEADYQTRYTAQLGVR